MGFDDCFDCGSRLMVWHVWWLRLLCVGLGWFAGCLQLVCVGLLLDCDFGVATVLVVMYWLLV